MSNIEFENRQVYVDQVTEKLWWMQWGQQMIEHFQASIRDVFHIIDQSYVDWLTAEKCAEKLMNHIIDQKSGEK